MFHARFSFTSIRRDHKLKLQFLFCPCLQAANVNPVFYEDATFIRSYMLALTGCLTAAIYLYKICFTESSPGKYYFMYFTGILDSLGSHYFTISLLGGMACFLFWNRAFSAWLFGSFNFKIISLETFSRSPY
jgi:hypothetical protein